jgi:hypothetical protein
MIPKHENPKKSMPRHTMIKFLQDQGGEAGHWWLTPIILAPHEAEIRRIMVQSQK